ncbi:MAG TPA: tetratricopeptide repeat protein [Drouetiella sp.]|jgi:tetratricopeptide (TPR) repeat protein
MWERYNLSGQQAMSSGRSADAEQAFRLALQEAEKIGAHDPKVAISCVNLANCLRQQGRFAESEELYKKAITVKERAFGPLHKELIPVLENYAKMLRAAGRSAEADKMDQKAKAIFVRP